MSVLASLPAAAVLAAALAAPTPGAVPAAPPCAGVTLPRRLTKPPDNLPPSYTATRIGGVVVDEALIGPDGAVSDVRLAHARLPGLAPFGQKSVQDSRFSGGTVDGHPATMRVRVSTRLGTIGKARVEPEYDSVWAYVAGGQSREAVWQLAGSVEKLTLEIHLGTAPKDGAEVVALPPGGKPRVLKKVPPSAEPIDLSETVATKGLFERAGDYRIELRAAGKSLAFTTVTIADDFTRAIVNACAPL